ncbi:hypothetical protein ACSQ67_020713 [Phaseolus vulgaris]
MDEKQVKEGGELERMEETKLFCEEMKEAQKAAMEKQWKEFKKIMMQKPENILKQFDLFGNTAIHVATRSHPQLLSELLEMVPDEEERFEDQLLTPQKKPLLELTNNQGETPLFVAAMHGKLKILKYMANRVQNLGKHFRRSDKYNALHASVIGQHFHVAIWLERMDEKLALEKDEKDLTCLQLLSKMPQVFRSHTHMGPLKNTIYHLLLDGYDNHEQSQLFKQKKDEENGKEDDEPTICKSAISEINYRFWKRMAKDGHTPEDMLEIEHDGMLKEAQKWGTENGTPVFLHSSVFLFFTIMDVVALATSLASVVVFLSILTSPCELWDFHKSLPRKLNLGFALLFFSLMTTMLAFDATMLLTIRLEWRNWTSTLIYRSCFLSVTIFAIIQFLFMSWLEVSPSIYGSNSRRFFQQD